MKDIRIIKNNKDNDNNRNKKMILDTNNTFENDKNLSEKKESIFNRVALYIVAFLFIFNSRYL